MAERSLVCQLGVQLAQIWNSQLGGPYIIEDEEMDQLLGLAERALIEETRREIMAYGDLRGSTASRIWRAVRLAWRRRRIPYSGHWALTPPPKQETE